MHSRPALELRVACAKCKSILTLPMRFRAGVRGVASMYWDVAQGLASGLIAPSASVVSHSSGALMVSESGGKILGLEGVRVGDGVGGSVVALARDAPGHVRRALVQCTELVYNGE